MTRLLDLPIPPKPDRFTPEGAPPGVAVDLFAYGPWTAGRPKIKPRVAIVHTNAARKEGSLQSQINWANASSSNTHPHYALNAPQPTKLLATDRRAIANSTPKWLEDQDGETDCSYWTIAIESADSGIDNDPGVSDFLYDHAELCARILAYESVVWGFPLAYPVKWNGTGVACHTEPFPDAYTLYPGKTCPGAKKKKAVRDEILPRAQQIRAAWLRTDFPEVIIPPVEEDEVPRLIINHKTVRAAFNEDGTIMTAETFEVARTQPNTTVIDSSHPEFLELACEVNGPAVAFELGKRAERFKTT